MVLLSCMSLKNIIWYVVALNGHIYIYICICYHTPDWVVGFVLYCIVGGCAKSSEDRSWQRFRYLALHTNHALQLSIDISYPVNVLSYTMYYDTDVLMLSLCFYSDGLKMKKLLSSYFWDARHMISFLRYGTITCYTLTMILLHLSYECLHVWRHMISFLRYNHVL